MSITVESGERQNVAHILIDRDDLNLVTTDWIEGLTAAARSVPSEASVVTVGAPVTGGDGVRGVSAGLDLEEGAEVSSRDAWDLVEGL
jgi:hypothetical protein